MFKIKLLVLTTLLFCAFTESYSQDFTSVWNTSLPGSPADQIIIPTNPVFTNYNYNVDWGDGMTDTGLTGNASHTYASPGTYTISITGSFPAIYFNDEGDRQKIVEIIDWGNIQWESMENAFWGCTSLNFDAINAPDLSQATSLKNMFRECLNFNGILNNWDVSNITDISGMFMDAAIFNRPLDNWTTNSVTVMSDTFNDADDFNEPLDNWTTNSVTTMARMFNEARSFNQNINSWNTAQVIDMSEMFKDTPMNFPLNNWVVDNVITMAGMFNDANFNQPIDSWNTSSVTDMSSMFQEGQFNQPLATFVTDNVVTMFRMFHDNEFFDQPINNWDVSNVTNMAEMFGGSAPFDFTVFNQPLDMWDVSNVTNMERMFKDTDFFNQPIGGWQIQNVTTMAGMFDGAKVFNQPLDGWTVTSVENMSTMFEQTPLFNQPLNNWTTTQVTNMSGMFNQSTMFNQVLDNWDTSSVTNMSSMFRSAAAFNQDLGVWDISQVSNMSNMLNNSGISEANYNAILIGWESQTVQTDLTLGAANLLYCDGRFARQDLIDNNGWTINDDIINCSFVLCTPIVSPVDGDILVPANFNLVWEPVTVATGYRLTVTKDTGGVITTVLDNEDVGNITIYDFPVDFTPGDIVTAVVIPFNAEGPAENCETISFTIVAPWNNGPDAFKLTFDTSITGSGSTPANQLRLLRNTSAGPYDYAIDWGDGQYNNNVDNTIVHTYETPGTYQIAIIGDYPAHFYNSNSSDARKLLTIDQWGAGVWQSMRQAFAYCENMTYNATDTPNLTEVESMSFMFYEALNFNGNIENWVTTNVTNMSGTFSAASSFDQPLNGWDVSNVTTMSQMFSGDFTGMIFNQPLDMWDVSNVTNMYFMFYNNTLFNQPLNSWDVDNVTTMGFTFGQTQAFNQPLDMWDVDNVTDFGAMFISAVAFNQNIENWETGMGINMRYMFFNADSFNQPLNDWDVSNVVDMEFMFAQTELFDQPLDQWNTTSLTNTESMFERTNSFNNTISTWNMSTVTSMKSMFEQSVLFNQNISGWNVTNVLDMESMFEEAESFDQPLINWDTNSVVTMESMFQGALVFNQPIGDWNVSAVATMTSMFRSAQLFDQPLDQWDTSSVTQMNSMFENAQVFNQNINDWDVASVTNFESMFQSAQLFDMPLDDWETNEALNMEEMFRSAAVFNQDIDAWNTSFVTTMEGMFQDAVAYNQPLGSWNTASVNTMERMFSGASIFDQNIDSWNTREVLTMEEMFFNAIAFNQPLNNWRVPQVNTMEGMFRNATSFNQTLDEWDLGQVTLRSMFRNATTFDQLLGDWNMAQVTNLIDVLDDSGMSRMNYDNTIIAWAEQTLPNGLNLGAQNVPYCDAFEEREEIIATYGWTFTGDVLDCPIPECTQLISPFDTEVDVPVNTNLTWEPAVFARGYRLTVVSVPPNANNIVDLELIDQTVYNFVNDFDGGEVVTVTIIPFNDEGDAVGCAPETFTIVVDPIATIPDCTSLSDPLNNTVDVVVDTDLTWNPVSNADGYKISIGTTTGGVDILDNFNVGNTTTLDLMADLPENTLIYVTITPFNEEGDANNCTEESFMTEFIPVPPECTNLTMPLDGAIDVDITTNLNWNAITDATGYLLTVGTTPGGNEVLNAVDVNNTTTYDFITDLNENDTYYVVIIPYNNIGDAVGCAEESFTTETIITTPDCTSLTNPLNSATGVMLGTDISWGASAMAVGYFLNIGTTSGGVDIINNQDVGNVTTFNLPNDLPEFTEIFITIVPYNADGSTVGCLEESFVTEVFIPDCVILTDPVNGATGVLIGTDLSWSAATTADGYILNVGTTSGGLDIINNQDVGNVTTFDLPVDLPEFTEIFVTVTSYNATGNAENCAEESFTTQLFVPDCASLTDPLNGTTGVLIDTDISWSAATTADGYILNVGTTSGGTDIINNQDVGDVTTFDLPVDLPEFTEIFVTIIPYNASGNAENCAEESFTTQLFVPDCVSLIDPFNGSTGVLVGIDLSWGVETTADGYILNVGTTSEGTDIINNQDVGNVTTFDLPVDLPEFTEIFVTVTPYNATGNAENCAEESFTTQLFVPDCASLTDPLNGATGVLIGTDLSWSVAVTADGYILNVGTTSGGTDIINNQDVGDVTTFDLPIDLPEFTEIFVTIIPYNATGNAENCTEESFTTQLFVPDCVSLIDPLNGATGVLVGIDLSWNVATTADGYILNVGTTSGGTDIINNQDVGNATTFDLPVDLPEFTEIFVTVTPYNATGNAENCVEESFTTQLFVPDCVSLTDPLNGATGVLIGTDLSWSAATTADGYILNVGTTSGGTDIINNQDLGDVTNFDLPADLPEFTEIFVTIIPYNATGNASGCAEESFTTQLFVPDCVSLIDPLNGADAVLIGTDLTWDVATTADGYILTVGTISGGTDIINNQDVGNVTTFDLPTDLPEASEIFVNITPYNNTGAAESCAEESFTTQTFPPSCTFLINPVDGDQDVSIATDLTWEAIDDATGYILTVETEIGTGNIINQLDVGDSVTYNLPNDLPQVTEVFVTVIPYNIGGEASSCEVASFTTELLPPECTSLSIPSNGSANVSIFTGLSWNPVDNADGYFVSAGTFPGGEDIIDFIDVQNVIEISLAEEWPENTTIYVTITPYNLAGLSEDCEEQTFTTEDNSVQEDNDQKFGFSPDGDGVNEYWEIKGINNYPDNVVSIYNRWGELVFETNGYDNASNAFRGSANRATGRGAGELPEGTYFFTIQIPEENNIPNRGYLVLKR